MSLSGDGLVAITCDLGDVILQDRDNLPEAVAFLSIYQFKLAHVHPQLIPLGHVCTSTGTRHLFRFSYVLRFPKPVRSTITATLRGFAVLGVLHSLHFPYSREEQNGPRSVDLFRQPQLLQIHGSDFAIRSLAVSAG